MLLKNKKRLNVLQTGIKKKDMPLKNGVGASQFSKVKKEKKENSVIW